MQTETGRRSKETPPRASSITYSNREHRVQNYNPRLKDLSLVNQIDTCQYIIEMQRRKQRIPLNRRNTTRNETKRNEERRISDSERREVRTKTQKATGKSGMGWESTPNERSMERMNEGDRGGRIRVRRRGPGSSYALQLSSIRLNTYSTETRKTA